MRTATGEECVLVAETSEARARGLMGFRTIEPWAGMLFTFDATPVHVGFYMKDTLIPLDIAFLGATGSVQEVIRMEPCPPEVSRCPTYTPEGPYASALEMEAGRSGTLGVSVGATMSFGGACE